MKKLFLVTFGGSPERAEICLYMNAAAGLYKNCEIHCYPIDKDITSPNYLNTREFYESYNNFRKIIKDKLKRINIKRTESMFEEMLKKADIESQDETILYLMSRIQDRSIHDQRLIDTCFTQDEQEYNMESGYYGKANIGSVTGKLLINKKVYQNEKFYQDIQSSLKAQDKVDVVIICSSFGGTGASLGINFGKFLRYSLKNEQNLRLHCIHIQPYFCFPNPNKDDKYQIDYKQFIEKSATLTAILAQENNLIKKDDEQAVFDRFYYIGQKPLDKISDKNSAAKEQNNKIHIVDMLVSLAIEDILSDKNNNDLQLYAYQYAANGTSKLSWNHMPYKFEEKHVQMMRFCEFMLDCMETLFDNSFNNYQTHSLIIHLYGKKSFFKNQANIDQNTDNKLREDMHKCIEFCRKYVQYWIELEERTCNGSIDSSVTSFFNIKELKRMADKKSIETFAERIKTNNNCDLYKVGDRPMDGIKQYTCLQIYNMLCTRDELKKIAKSEQNAASILISLIYKMSSINYVDND